MVYNLHISTIMDLSLHPWVVVFPMSQISLGAPFVMRSAWLFCPRNLSISWIRFHSLKYYHSFTFILGSHWLAIPKTLRHSISYVRNKFQLIMPHFLFIFYASLSWHLLIHICVSCVAQHLQYAFWLCLTHNWYSNKL